MGSMAHERISFGRRQEFLTISKLISEDCDVYMTLVDDRGIDCVIRKDDGKYLDIQIKARSKNCRPENIAHFPGLKIEKARKNYYFIFYSEKLDKFWVIPSSVVVEKSREVKSGKNAGKYYLTLARPSKNGIKYNLESTDFSDPISPLSSS